MSQKTHKRPKSFGFYAHKVQLTFSRMLSETPCIQGPTGGRAILDPIIWLRKPTSENGRKLFRQKYLISFVTAKISNKNSIQFADPPESCEQQVDFFFFL